MSKGGRREFLFANSPGVFPPFAKLSVESGFSFSACRRIGKDGVERSSLLRRKIAESKNEQRTRESKF